MNQRSVLVKYRKQKIAVTGLESVLVVLRVLCWARRWTWKGNPNWNTAQFGSHDTLCAREKHALMQSPHRFPTKRQLWAYSSLELKTYASGEYRFVAGQLKRSKGFWPFAG
jgi:hypothetical protein